MHIGPVWRHPLLWLLTVFFALATANGMILPSFEAIDEPEHFNLIRYLAEGHGLPDQRDFDLAYSYGYAQEGGQAPLYYFLGALILLGLGEDVGDVDALTVPNPLSTCGDTSQPYSKGLWMRDPRRERWPYRGAALGVHVLRLFGAALGLLTVSGVYLAARATFPSSRPVALVAAALVGLSPRFLTHSATITNDNLLVALLTWGVYLSVDALRRGLTWTRMAALGALAGLAALTKVSGLFLLPLAVLAIADLTWRDKRWVRGLGHVALVGSVCVLVAGWWYVGNLVRYGEPALVPLITQDSGQRASWPSRLVLPETYKVLYTYWAASPYCEIRLGVFPVYAVASLLGLAGLGLALRRASPAARRRVALLLVWAGVTFLAWFFFNTSVWAPDGRYLFPAHAAIAPLLAAGLMAVVGRWSIVWRGLIVGLGALAMATPIGMLAPLFNPPSRYPAELAPITRPLDALFGDEVKLLGYDVGDETLRAGDALDVTLFLEAERPITQNLMLGLQLVSAGPYDNSVLVNFRSWPGGGNYPTTAWQLGEVLADRYQLQLPVDVVELQTWDLSLLLLRAPGQEGGGKRLPVRVGGVPGDSYVILSRIRVEPGAEPAIPADVMLDAPPTFGPNREVRLTAADVVREGAYLRTLLWWQVSGALDGDYKVFVQLLDGEDHLLASGDDFPRGGAMPTGFWRSGDVIVDEYRVALPEDLVTGEYRIAVGLYGAERRLPAWDVDGHPLMHDAALLPGGLSLNGGE